MQRLLRRGCHRQGARHRPGERLSGAGGWIVEPATASKNIRATDDETWVIETGDRIVRKKTSDSIERLSPWRRWSIAFRLPIME
jgi:hypothetical protein